MVALNSPIEHPIDEYRRLCREITMLQARAAVVLAEIDRRRWYDDAGFLTATAFVRETAGVSSGEAHRRVGEARQLARHDRVRQAFLSADLDRPRVSMVLHAAAVSPETFDRDEAVLVDRVGDLSMLDARRLLAYWVQAAAPDFAAAAERGGFEMRRLSISETAGGRFRLDGDLDPESGRVVATAIGSLVEPTYLDRSDTRSHLQRRADALVELCADHLAHGEAPIQGGFRPQVTLEVAREVLATGRPAVPCEVDGTVVTPPTARRIACDAAVVDADDPLDYRRTTRVIPASLRRALLRRDRGCTWSGCGRPARWCDAHHIEHWGEGGPTSLANLRLLCRRHHRMIHDEAPIPERPATRRPEKVMASTSRGSPGP